MEEQKTELKLIKMSEVQSQEIEWLMVSLYPLWKADNYPRRPG